jgi:hypothetical protein
MGIKHQICITISLADFGLFFSGGPLFAKTAWCKKLNSLLGEKVTLSPIVLVRLRASAFLRAI